METNFAELGLGEALLCALESKGYSKPTPIQTQAIPEVLKGSDILATAQTGTGKTASFALPMLQRLSETEGEPGLVRALILTPTRELAEQIDRNIQLYAKELNIESVVLVGGVSIQGQRRKLRRRPEVVVATPGRLLDLLKQKVITIAKVETLVLDEADRMLDMGFIDDVKKIIKKTQRSRQTLLFSATLSKDINSLSSDILRDPVSIEIAPSATIAENLDQSVYFVEQNQKKELLIKTLKGLKGSRVLVFTRTKRRANHLSEQLCEAGISADAIHSNKSQGARRRSLAAFDSGKVSVLVATDVVARGIDVKEITHVINFEMPEDTESYVHRIGRTARAKKSGHAFSFCEASEIGMLQAIEKFIKIKLTIEDEQPFHSHHIGRIYLTPQKVRKARRGGGGGGNRGRSGGDNRGRHGGDRGRSSGDRRRTSGRGDRRGSGDGRRRRDDNRGQRRHQSEPGGIRRRSEESFGRGRDDSRRSDSRDSNGRGRSGEASSQSRSYRGRGSDNHYSNNIQRSDSRQGESRYGNSNRESGGRGRGGENSGQGRSYRGRSGDGQQRYGGNSQRSDSRRSDSRQGGSRYGNSGQGGNGRSNEQSNGRGRSNGQSYGGSDSRRGSQQDRAARGSNNRGGENRGNNERGSHSGMKKGGSNSNFRGRSSNNRHSGGGSGRGRSGGQNSLGPSSRGPRGGGRARA